MGSGAGLGEVLSIHDSRYPTWEYDLLRTLGGNPTQLPNSLMALNLLAKQENVTETAHNWLAVSAPPTYPLSGMSGTLSGNKDYIATFATSSKGVSGIAEFLRNGKQYSKLVALLTSPNSSLADIGRAINATGAWGSEGNLLITTSGEPIQQQATSSPYVTAGDTQIGPGGGSVGHGSTSFNHCTGATIIGGGGLGVHWNILNSCQAKALAGGLLVGLGGVIMAGGLIIVATGAMKSSGGSTLSSAAKAIPGPVGKVGGAVSALFSSRGSGKSTRSSSPASSPEVFEGRTLSPQQSAYRREKGDAALSDAFARQKKAGVVK